MKRFLKESFLFGVTLVVLFYSYPIFQLWSRDFEEDVNGTEVYEAINASKKESLQKKLYLGDSVARQLLGGKKKKKVNHLACNQAIGLVGHFVLLQNYLKVNEGRLDSVILIYSPFSFVNNLDQEYTFHYFLKPFYTKEYQNFFSQEVERQIKKIPFYWLSQDPFVKTTNWSPNYLGEKEKNGNLFSPISMAYLDSVFRLCEKHLVGFKIKAPPTRISLRMELDGWRVDYPQNLFLEEEVNRYLTEVPFLPDSNFSDKVHLKHPELYFEKCIGPM